MKSKLVKITFKFENCDQITIDGTDIGYFVLKDIHEDMSMNENGIIDCSKLVDTFAIEIHSSANKERYPFNLPQLKDLIKQTTFTRLLYDDIVSINFTVEDNEDGSLHSYTYYVYWNESDIVNTAQNGYISNLGRLYISISKDYSFEDFFNIDAINNENLMYFHWKR